MAGINLSKAVRSNLLSLQATAAAMARTQERLATGLRVNSALDNPSNFFTASALKSRASDMSNLLDAMSNGVKTLEAADNGLKAITKTVESMQSTLRQARQDKSFQGQTFGFGTDASVARTITFNGGALGNLTTALSVDTAEDKYTLTGDTYSNMDFSGGGKLTFDMLVNDTLHAVEIEATGANTLSVTVDGQAGTTSIASQSAVTLDEMVAGLNAGLDAGGVKATASASSGKLVLASDVYATTTVAAVAVAGFTVTGSVDTTDFLGAGGPTFDIDSRFKSVDAIVNDINTNTQLNGAVRASNDNGKLRIENLSTSALDVGNTQNGVINGATDETSVGGNDTRSNLVKQFNELRDQLDKFADDASFNGINLLRGDKLKLTFNETGSSTIDIQAKDAAGAASSISNQRLGIDEALTGDLDSDAAIDARLDVLKTALDRLRSQSSAFGSNLSIVENRTDFTKAMINTLKTGADNLTLADTNEEAAKLLALQTRQQLSSTALSMASQADQAVLRLF